MQRKFAVVPLLLGMLLLTGCGGQEADSQEKTLPPPEPAQPSVTEQQLAAKPPGEASVTTATIQWQDSALEAMVRDYLDKPSGGITQAELAFVHNLTIFGDSHLFINGDDKDGVSLAELGGLEIDETGYVIDGVRYGCGSIQSLADLPGFVNLSSVEIICHQVSDLSPIPAIPYLTSLVVTGNQISDLSPLADTGNLSNLDCGYNQISDLTPLAALYTLEYLFLDHNLLTDISPLAGLTGLTQLLLSDNQISDISPLGEMTALYYLNLSGNPITDWSPVAGLSDRVVIGRPETEGL